MAQDTTPADPRARGAFTACLVAATILGAALRIYQLQDASFWNEELYTIRSCTDLASVHHSKVFGYLPTALGLWLHGVNPHDIPVARPEAWRAMGVTEWWARLPSCLIGIVSIPLLALAAGRVIGGRAAGLLALLLAVSPWHIYWSQASRFYTQQYLFYNVALLWYFRATADASRRRFIAAMAVMVLAFFTQPPALVICAVFAADRLIGWMRRDGVRIAPFDWAAGVAAVGVCLLVWRLDFQRNPDQWTQFAGSLYQTPAKLVLGTAYMVHPVLLLFAALSSIWLYAERPRLALYLVFGAVVPLAAFAVLSTRSYVALRYTFVTQFSWAALAALGAAELSRVLRPRFRWAGAVAPAGILLTAMMLMNYGYYTSGRGFHTRWADAYAYVARQRQPGEAVLAKKPRMGRYYLEDRNVDSLPPTVEELRALGRAAWIVVETDDAVRGRVLEWIDSVADWRRSFDVRVIQPYSSVRVYYFDPAADRKVMTAGASRTQAGSVMIPRTGDP